MRLRLPSCIEPIFDPVSFIIFGFINSTKIKATTGFIRICTKNRIFDLFGWARQIRDGLYSIIRLSKVNIIIISL